MERLLDIINECMQKLQPLTEETVPNEIRWVVFSLLGTLESYGVSIESDNHEINKWKFRKGFRW